MQVMAQKLYSVLKIFPEFLSFVMLVSCYAQINRKEQFNGNENIKRL